VAVARPRLLILRALGIGDVLTAVPALRGLAQAFPGHERLIAAPAALRALIDLVETEGGGPAVHGILDARGLHSLPAQARHPDVAVNLHGRGPQSHRLLLEQRPGETLWFASAAVAASRGSPRWRPSEHEVMRWCRMLAESGVPCRPDRLELRAPAGPPPAGSRGATLLHPGAASPARASPRLRAPRRAEGVG
jgi:hypothetical protein